MTNYKLQTVRKIWDLDFGNSRSGFTLIEVLVSIAILAVIAVVSFPNLKGFNERTSVQNVSKNLAAALKTAQVNARTGVVCPHNGLYPIDWDIVVQSNGYYYRIHCKDLSTGTTAPEDDLPFVSFPSGISASFPVPSGWPWPGLAINFYPSSLTNDDYIGSQPLWPYQYTISDGTTRSIVQIDQGGNITIINP